MISGFHHVIAAGPGRSAWMAQQLAYRIELWESDRLLRSLRREAKWFPEVPASERAQGWEEKPDPTLVGIAADDSLLWVFVATAAEQWEKAAESHDYNLFYDTTIEVIDWRRGQVIGSERFDESYFHWIKPGLFGQLVVTAEGSVRYRTTRVRLGRPPGLEGEWAGPRSTRGLGRARRRR